MATKHTITKDQLTDFATAGVAQRIAAIEDELAMYHRQWPQLFLTATAPQLLKVPAKSESSSNGHRPTPSKASAGIKASWTPARRAAHADEVKARWKKGVYGKGKKSKSKKSTSTRPPAGRLDKVRAYLKQHGESSGADLMAAAGYRKSSGLISAMATGIKSGHFVRVSRGRYTLGPKA